MTELQEKYYKYIGYLLGFIAILSICLIMSALYKCEIGEISEIELMVRGVFALAVFYITTRPFWG